MSDQVVVKPVSFYVGRSMSDLVNYCSVDEDVSFISRNGREEAYFTNDGDWMGEIERSGSTTTLKPITYAHPTTAQNCFVNQVAGNASVIATHDAIASRMRERYQKLTVSRPVVKAPFERVTADIRRALRAIGEKKLTSGTQVEYVDSALKVDGYPTFVGRVDWNGDGKFDAKFIFNYEFSGNYFIAPEYQLIRYYEETGTE